MRAAARDRKHLDTAYARIWRGRTRCERADEYEAYNDEARIKPLIRALAVQTSRENLEDETEFTTISYWESIEAMREFTSSDRLELSPAGSGIPARASQNVQILRLPTRHGLAYAGRKDSD